MTGKFKKSNERLEKVESIIPLASQTFSKSFTQFPKGSSPIFLKKGQGASVWDLDDNQFTDYISALFSISLGYCDDDVNQAVINQLNQGVNFSLPHELEYEVASLLIEHIPSAEMVRFGKNGSDVTSAAIRLARAYTDREFIAICGYHGWHDWYIGSTSRDLGVPEAVKSLSLTFEYNNLQSLIDLFKKYPNQIAGVILEPINFFPPENQFLTSVIELCDAQGAVCIFDEIITGFRFAMGGAQSLFNVVPHITCLGKGMANGFPLSAVVGRKDIMSLMENIFFSGTFAGEAVSLAASKATIQKMNQVDAIGSTHSTGQYLIDQFSKEVSSLDTKQYISLIGYPCWPMLKFNMKNSEHHNLIKTYLIQHMIDNHILISGSHNLNYAHTKQDIDKLIDVYKEFTITINQLKKIEEIHELIRSPVIEPIFAVRNTS